ncbi:hypothetical protein M422DRAFT_259969 [Sphaerobolus stellatus SS14]|uniref:Uncharacterized protein n=1 Tax=Sphaerobolus stellatus (strain SS14) TaxID=990650 RepID=A0A0C9US05_SPHS4|nr:hypothetical protein M422DRAFT_259969 [Sphaerobolus stellatus SS14]
MNQLGSHIRSFSGKIAARDILSDTPFMSQYPAFVSPFQPSQGGQRPPAAGYRYPLTAYNPFPDIKSLPPTKLHDIGDPSQPIYVGSVAFQNAIHPCKTVPHLDYFVRVPYGGREVEPHGRYDILPIDENWMEWVQTSHGRIPPGRRPVEDGFEETREKLFHALAKSMEIGFLARLVNTFAKIPFGGERIVQNDYLILFMLEALNLEYWCREENYKSHANGWDV